METPHPDTPTLITIIGITVKSNQFPVSLEILDKKIVTPKLSMKIFSLENPVRLIFEFSKKNKIKNTAVKMKSLVILFSSIPQNGWIKR